MSANKVSMKPITVQGEVKFRKVSTLPFAEQSSQRSAEAQVHAVGGKVALVFVRHKEVLSSKR
jgi:hypothetical protein